MIEVKPLQADQWALYKQMRIAALADAPHAFTASWTRAVTRLDAEWMQLVERRAQEKNNTSFIAYCDGVPCGMAACIVSDGCAEMLAVWVVPAFRRRKVGDALIAYAKSWSTERHLPKMIVGVFEDNTAAVKFYRAAGFSLNGAPRFDPAQPKRPILLLEMILPTDPPG